MKKYQMEREKEDLTRLLKVTFPLHSKISVPFFEKAAGEIILEHEDFLIQLISWTLQQRCRLIGGSRLMCS
jgi:hypothetical protein